MSQRRALQGAILVAWGFLPSAALAQDSQYWTLQYSPVAELLGGTVVGSSRDLSATFYNPGALALTKNPSLLASPPPAPGVRSLHNPAVADPVRRRLSP